MGAANIAVPPNSADSFHFNRESCHGNKRGLG